MGRAERRKREVCARTTRLTKGRMDDRTSLLDHAQWPQDHDLLGGERAFLSHRAGQYQRRQPVQAGVPQGTSAARRPVHETSGATGTMSVFCARGQTSLLRIFRPAPWRSLALIM